MQKCRKSRTISRALPEANRPRSEHRLPDSTPGIRAGPRLSAVTLPNCRPRSMRTPFQVQRDGLVIIAVVEKIGLLGSADEQACRATRLQPPACIELAQMRNGPLNNRSGLRTPSAPAPAAVDLAILLAVGKPHEKIIIALRAARCFRLAPSKHHSMPLFLHRHRACKDPAAGHTSDWLRENPRGSGCGILR